MLDCPKGNSKPYHMIFKIYHVSFDKEKRNRLKNVLIYQNLWNGNSFDIDKIISDVVLVPYSRFVVQLHAVYGC